VSQEIFGTLVLPSSYRTKRMAEFYKHTGPPLVMPNLVTVGQTAWASVGGPKNWRRWAGPGRPLR